jgi:cation diffusion facilitator CzcD-associated flavoprotein CzcO
MTAGHKPGAVVIGGYLAGLGAVRALARQGVPVAVVVTRANGVAHDFRWVAERHVLKGTQNQCSHALCLAAAMGGNARGRAELRRRVQAMSADYSYDRE